MEDKNIPSSDKIEDGCFLSPYKVFFSRFIHFGSILFQDLMSNIMFLFWMCGTFLSKNMTRDHDTRDYLNASEHVEIFGCIMYTSFLSMTKRMKNDPVYWRLRWIYFHSVMGTRFLISVGYQKLYQEILRHGYSIIYPFQKLLRPFIYWSTISFILLLCITTPTLKT